MKTIAIAIIALTLASAPAAAEWGEWNQPCTWKADVLNLGFCGLDGE